MLPGGENPLPMALFSPLDGSHGALHVVLVPCMRKTCKGKFQSACCLMNVFSFFSPSLSCAFRRQQCGRWVLFTLFFQLSFAFYFLALTESISNVDGKWNIFLSICGCVDCASLFIQNTQNCTPGTRLHM